MTSIAPSRVPTMLDALESIITRIADKSVTDVEAVSSLCDPQTRYYSWGRFAHDAENVPAHIRLESGNGICIWFIDRTAIRSDASSDGGPGQWKWEYVHTPFPPIDVLTLDDAPDHPMHRGLLRFTEDGEFDEAAMLPSYASDIFYL